MDEAVVPATGLPSPSVQSKTAPPHSWTSIPRTRAGGRGTPLTPSHSTTWRSLPWRWPRRL